VAFVKFSDVESERLFAWVAPWNWNQVLAILRNIRPIHKFPEDLPGLSEDIGKVPTVKEVELLHRLGRPGWTELSEILEDGLQSMSL
jgi:hypothetical protein